ncbi:MAG TPA: site-2 protease family protein [Candidatus Acidoferrum sp.]|nr:site-2 protease family protein [Candidatus Acidoferrum sp.]
MTPSSPVPEAPPTSLADNPGWNNGLVRQWYYAQIPPRPSKKSLAFAVLLFLLTLCTCLVAGTQFAFAYEHNEAASISAFLRSFTLFYKNPAGLLAGLPFAATLLGILLAHELGHFFACRHHHLYASYPFFIPFPNLAGTFGAFIMIRSPMRTNRALFDVGASGPIVGFIFAIPALFYGVLHAKFVPELANPANAELIYGTPLLLRWFEAACHPHLSPNALLLPPIGRAAWVALFVTSLNLVPVAQLDGGHILRSLSVRAHRVFSLLLPIGLIVLGWLHFWEGWYIWGALLLVMRFLRIPPVYDPSPLDAKRRLWALLALIIFVLCFMPSPISIPPSSP